MARKLLLAYSIVTMILFVDISKAQVVWSGANAVSNCNSGYNGNWLTKNNWCGGILPNGNTSAQFAANGSASAIIISMGVVTLTTTTTFGCIELTEANTISRTISNNSTNYPGNIYLNGLTVNGSSNTILSNRSSVPLTINSITGKSLDIVFNNSEENVISIEGKGDINLNAIISGKGKKLVKSGTGSGVLNLSAANSYDGGTVINSGTIVFSKANSLGLGDLILNGGVFQTNLQTNEALSIGNGVLKLTNNSTIQLCKNVHYIYFSPSSSAIWESGKILTIKGWQGPYDGSSIGTGGRINIGNNGLTATQLSQVQFFDGTSVFSAKLNAQYLVPEKILPPEISSSLSLIATFNNSLYYQITGTNSPTLFSARNLPAGLSIDSQTGVISGIPTEEGSFTSDISAINSSGAGTKTLSIQVHGDRSCIETPLKPGIIINLNSFCAGGSTTLQLSNFNDPITTPGISLEWYKSTNNTDFTPVEGGTTEILSTGTLTQTTFYYNKVTCSYSGMFSNTDTVVITVLPIPETPQVTVQDNCGSSVLSTTAPGDLLWSNGEKTNTITVVTAGKYSLITTIDGCSSGIFETTAAPNPLPTSVINNTSGNSTLTCSQTSIHLTGSGGTDFLWWKDSELIGNSPAVDIINGGNYTLSVTDANGCSSETSIIIETDLNSPGASINASETILTCIAAVVTLTASGNGSYLWSTAERTQTISVTKAGTYSVTVTGSNGCQSGADIVITSLIQSPAAPLINVVNNCGYSVLTANNYTGDLLWNTGETIQTITVTTPGTYSVYQSIEGCTSAEISVQVNIKQSIASITASNNGPLCLGSTLNLDATAITNANYSWTGPNGFSSNARKATIRNITPASSGDYTVVATINGCNTQPAITHVSVNDIPTPVIISSGSTTFCEASKVTLSTSSPYSEYKWNTGSMQPILEVTTTGTYYVSVVDNGCSGTSAPVTITVNSNPQVYNLIGSTIICSNSANLQPALTGSQKNIRYNLYIDGNLAASATGTGRQIIFPQQTKPGNYTAIAENASGCRVEMNGQLNVSLSPPIYISLNEPKAYPIGSSANTIYDGWTPASSVTLTVSTSGGTPPYTYSWSNSSGKQVSSLAELVVTPTLINGEETFALTISDYNGCSSSISRTIYSVPVTCSISKKEKGVQLCINDKNSCVPSIAVENLLTQGASLGRCLPVNIFPVANTATMKLTPFSVIAYPNPTSRNFKLQIKTGNKKDKINLEVSDVTGRIISIIDDIPAEKVFEIGDDLKVGLYIFNIVQGDKQQHIKVIKLP